MANTFEEIARQSRLSAHSGLPVGPARATRVFAGAELAGGLTFGEGTSFLAIAETLGSSPSILLTDAGAEQHTWIPQSGGEIFSFSDIPILISEIRAGTVVQTLRVILL